MTILGTPYDAKMAKFKKIPAFPLVFAYLNVRNCTYAHTSKQANKQTNKQTNEQTNKQTKQINRQI
jgi:hypothetical protein